MKCYLQINFYENNIQVWRIKMNIINRLKLIIQIHLAFGLSSFLFFIFVVYNNKNNETEHLEYPILEEYPIFAIIGIILYITSLYFGKIVFRKKSVSIKDNSIDDKISAYQSVHIGRITILQAGIFLTIVELFIYEGSLSYYEMTGIYYISTLLYFIFWLSYLPSANRVSDLFGIPLSELKEKENIKTEDLREQKINNAKMHFDIFEAYTFSVYSFYACWTFFLMIICNYIGDKCLTKHIEAYGFYLIFFGSYTIIPIAGQFGKAVDALRVWKKNIPPKEKRKLIILFFSGLAALASYFLGQIYLKGYLLFFGLLQNIIILFIINIQIYFEMRKKHQFKTLDTYTSFFSMFFVCYLAFIIGILVLIINYSLLKKVILYSVIYTFLLIIPYLLINRIIKKKRRRPITDN